jgi:DNA-binding transcriptional MocR family regulator
VKWIIRVVLLFLLTWSCLAADKPAGKDEKPKLAQSLDELRQQIEKILKDTHTNGVSLWPRRRWSERALITAAVARGVGVYEMSRYFLTKPPRTGILLGYSRMKEDEILEGIRRISEVL